MPKKSNKTSHVLNLLTNRTGLSTEELVEIPAPKTLILDISECIRVNLEKVDAYESGIRAERDALRKEKEIKMAVVKKTKDPVSDGTMDGLTLTNVLEEVLRLEAPSIMSQLDMCCCERCVNDVMAITLNNLQPKYIVSQKGTLFATVASYGMQYRTDIYSKLTAAAVTVSKSPNH